MRQYLFGLAAAVAVAVSSAPAMACYTNCAPVLRLPSCANPCSGYGYGYGAANWAVATVPAPVTYYAVQPQYHWVNQGPTYTGPGMYAPSVAYQARSVGGWSGYNVGYYGYDGGPYANPTSHYYHGMPAVSTPTVYSYRRAYRAARYSYAPRVWRAPRMYAPHMHAPSVRYGYRVAPRPHAHHHHHQHHRQWRVYK